MHATSLLIWIISVMSILGMLLRPRGVAEAWWICGGASLLVATRLLSFQLAGRAILKGLDVYLFLAGMMVLAELARETGVFDWVAEMAVRHANGSPSRLFLLIYLTGTLVTALLSNDATAVVLTPAVLAIVRRAKVKPKPYLLSCALIANAASFILPISNPANLVVFARQMPPLASWLGKFLLPSIASIAVTYFCLRFLRRGELHGSIEDQPEQAQLSTVGKLAFTGLLLSGVVLIVASVFGTNLGLPTCSAALFAIVIVGWRDRAVPAKVLRAPSWSILLLVAGLFTIVEALETTGLLKLAIACLNNVTQMPRIAGNMTAAFAVGLLSNVMNNLPMGLISGAAIQGTHQMGSLTNAVLIGVDLGPNLSVYGSLATILWLIALREEKVEITAGEFLKTGLIVMPIALLCSILMLRP